MSDHKTEEKWVAFCKRITPDKWTFEDVRLWLWDARQEGAKIDKLTTRLDEATMELAMVSLELDGRHDAVEKVLQECGASPVGLLITAAKCVNTREAAMRTAKRRGTELDKLRLAITAALGEIKRNDGSPRLGLRGIERILSHALEGK